ncbi:MAG: GWxTD domain-containing protein [Ignavibacteria bacterium]|jgi:GWxTD domain-containing protein|nr:GWxTD domain-containing protein [Ignavibacteria bacterium]
MRKILIILISILIGNIFGQKLTESNVFLDYSRFKYNSDSVYFELYYGISNKALKVSDNINEAEIRVILKDQNDNLAGYRNFRIVNEINEQNFDGEKYLTGVLGFKVQPGQYALKFDVIDYFDSTNSISISFPLKISSISTKNFALSDIQLCSNIIENSDNEGSYFYKNTYETYPNPSNVYGEQLPILFYYIELYDLLKGENTNNLKLISKVIDAQGREKYSREKLIQRKYNSIVEVGAINITKYPSGTYTLAIYLIDSLNNFGLVSSKKFYIFNPQIKEEIVSKRTDADLLSSEFSVMTEEELNLAFEQSKYIATSDEIKRWNSLSDLDAKKNFLFNFWKQRDPDPNTSENERKIEYFERVKKADEMFRGSREKGWRSDRGRVYIVYGEPSEIDRYPNEMDAYPYEIWSYNNIEGGVIFVFGDITGTGQMILIHSTHRGEMHDENWFRRVQKSR